MAKYIICPCTGEVPFATDDILEVMNCVVTQEYYAVNLSTMKLVEEDGTDGEDLNVV